MLTSATLVTAVGALLTRDLTAASVQRTCRQLAELLPVDGVAVTVSVGPGSRVLVGASDESARRLELAQLTAGVGPCTEATAGGTAVVIEDLPAVVSRWPGLADQLVDVAIGAVVATGLHAGHAVIGSMDTYRRDRHGWRPGELADIARTAQVLALGLAALQVTTPDDVPTVPIGEEQVQLAQATGMVLAALGLSAPDALSRLRATAFTQGRLVTEVAGDVVAGRLAASLD